MAVCIRLSRFGRLHRPFFRIVAIDRRNAREGLSNEVIGTYDPALDDGKAITVKPGRVEAWLAKGAILSDALRNLFKHHGVAVQVPPKRKVVAAKPAKAAAKAKPAAKAKKGEKQAFVPAKRRALKKHQAKLKAERKIKTAAEAAAAAAAKAAAAPAEAAAEAPKG